MEIKASQFNRPDVMNDLFDLSIIIVNYNVREFLHNALVSIGKATEGLRTEIFVVDNASDDGSGAMVSSLFPHAQFIRNELNAGFAAANNQALVRASGKYCVLINPDTIVQEDTFRVLIDFLETHPGAGMVGCKILNPDGTLQPACRRSFPTPWVAFTKIIGLSSLFPSSRILSRYNMSYLDPDASYEVDAISGSFMMIRREVYEKVGGLDENFFMYGEDLDWCYRVQQNGSKVWYVPETQIIHYKGESTRRSNIDEVRVFYDAMYKFVRKHHRSSILFRLFLDIGIFLRSLIAAAAKFSSPLFVAVGDAAIVTAGIFIAAYIYNHHFLSFPEYAYPWVILVPSLITVIALAAAGVYTNRRFSVSRSIVGVLGAYVIIAALTAFFKHYAFSRGMVLISGTVSMTGIAGWRLMMRIFGFRRPEFRKSLFGRRTVIVGIDNRAQELLKKLRSRPGEGYMIVGMIDMTRQRIGETIEGIPILGSVETIGKVIAEYKISEVIFSTETLSYGTMLSIISKSRNTNINFRMVPTSLEVIIGKGSIDQLSDVPFIEIEYNLNRFVNRFFKRSFDILVSLFFLIFVTPFVYLLAKKKRNGSFFIRAMLAMPSVCRGSMSFIGREPDISPLKNFTKAEDVLFLGKPGITGIVQIQTGRLLTPEEREKFELYYARNHSFGLDFEIFLKTLIQWQRRDQN